MNWDHLLTLIGHGALALLAVITAFCVTIWLRSCSRFMTHVTDSYAAAAAEIKSLMESYGHLQNRQSDLIEIVSDLIARVHPTPEPPTETIDIKPTAPDPIDLPFIYMGTCSQVHRHHNDHWPVNGKCVRPSHWQTGTWQELAKRVVAGYSASVGNRTYGPATATAATLVDLADDDTPKGTQQ